MKRLFPAIVAATFAICAHAQSSGADTFPTPSGTVSFTHAGHDFVGLLEQQSFDRFGASTLKHFDDAGNSNGTVARMLVQTDEGPVLYDFRHRPPLVQRTGQRMTVRRVFWQGDEVVMQSSQGWFRFQHGVLTKLQASTTTYH
ncbi:hypothetical protein [Paraburkholderia sp. BCC1886]|uniref:hypothetical protein n=1 Tax=Paraburkholderia sp. BCC1886 TaxID=2562670 RepID=UPI001182A0B0|nr:hypothetical protein [Paraburkholderia sp. BCC1886]